MEQFIRLFSFFTGKTIWQLVLEQFDDLLVKILLLAAIISFVSIIFYPSEIIEITNLHLSHSNSETNWHNIDIQRNATIY